ncbi:MAG: hypothetical protein K2G40_07940, partial [Muribaculaceae bacterium]|nr:hypothetical protein [Muribaculaceae bacterium]
KLELILALTDGLDEWEDDDQEQENAYNNERDNDTEADEYNDPVSDVENNVQSNPSISEDTHPVIPHKNDLINDTVEQDSEILSEQSAIDEYLEYTIEHAAQVQPDATSQQDLLNKFSDQENSLPVENTTTVISEDIPIEDT